MAGRLKTFDEDALIAEDEVVGSTASCTGVNIDGLSVGTKAYVALIDTTVTTGTVDGSNYYTLQLEGSDAVGGTYYSIGNPIVLPATAGSYQVAFTSEQLNDIIADADYFRVTATKTGSTATAVTYTAQINLV